MTWEDCYGRWPYLEEEIRSYLNVTWHDDVTDRNVRGYIISGCSRLMKLCGESLDFGTGGEANTLLKEYCRYARDGAADLFEVNYRSQIISLQTAGKVEAYAKSRPV